ncbi:hypothetical protein F2Q70_00005231 [Brassica cretica]|uniref:Uncharacterized protein n=1 Tax=Brassica cretica TaxID=69181 RepID=A0A8S9FS84_BRACR|nr:hypothetical protein F2Q68_00021870 [Brassica cretica]KAF2576517.1 hypothetical protein F2Q70_00005231 [Brassica cretica]
MSKDEILRHVQDKYLIPLQDTNRAVCPSSQAGPSRAANGNAIENKNFQTSQQQPVIPKDFCPQVLNALGHIIKLLTDGHGLGPHPSATGFLKRKRVDENEERGENEGEKLQENERGVNEEAEKKIIEERR